MDQSNSSDGETVGEAKRWVAYRPDDRSRTPCQVQADAVPIQAPFIQTGGRPTSCSPHEVRISRPRVRGTCDAGPPHLDATVGAACDPWRYNATAPTTTKPRSLSLLRTRTRPPCSTLTKTVPTDRLSAWCAEDTSGRRRARDCAEPSGLSVAQPTSRIYVSSHALPR